MLEFLLASSLTILPDFLFRRFVQGKQVGREITLFSVWYQLRWGITACVLLTLSLITVIFYFILRPAAPCPSSAPYRFCPKPSAGWRKSTSGCARRWRRARPCSGSTAPSSRPRSRAPDRAF